jgi:hypothetical protein
MSLDSVATPRDELSTARELFNASKKKLRHCRCGQRKRASASAPPRAGKGLRGARAVKENGLRCKREHLPTSADRN